MLQEHGNWARLGYSASVRLSMASLKPEAAYLTV
jgi:hypothetical protein